MSTRDPLNVAVIGCGLIGARRAEVVAQSSDARVVVVADTDADKVRTLATRHRCPGVATWQEALRVPNLQVVIVSTPNAFALPIGVAAMSGGAHVLIEKPMGRNLEEAVALADAARRQRRVLKIGFNHRYHPAIAKAHALVRDGGIGKIIHVRARYGHGGRPGYEREWRGNPELAGGGELTDQGVHVADLIHWFCGLPASAFAMTQTAVWPLQPLEDNGFGLFRFATGAVASFHTSWTQWKNLFSFEVAGTLGAVAIEGLGRSYGTERLIVTRRRVEGGVPEQSDEAFPDEDPSWTLEWEDFRRAVCDERHAYLGTPEDGVAAMRMLAALYASSRTNQLIALDAL